MSERQTHPDVRHHGDFRAGRPMLDDDPLSLGKFDARLLDPRVRVRVRDVELIALKGAGVSSVSTVGSSTSPSTWPTMEFMDVGSVSL